VIRELFIIPLNQIVVAAPDIEGFGIQVNAYVACACSLAAVIIAALFLFWEIRKLNNLINKS